MKIRRGFLYLADLNPRLGTEPGKTRPVLVIQNDLLNEAEHLLTWIIPYTTRLSGESLLRVFLPRGMAGNGQDCGVMIDQSRTIDNRRFARSLKPLPPGRPREVEEKLRLIEDLKRP